MNNVQSYNIALYITINTEFTRSLVPLVVQRYRAGGKREAFYRMIIGQELIYSLYCTNRAFSCDVITFEITKENRKQPQDRCFYGNLHEMSDIFIMLLICVESNKYLTCGFFNR